MTNSFSLSRAPARVLITTLQSADGLSYAIDPSFRTVLACLRYIANPDSREVDKRIYIARKFFLNHPPADYAPLFSAFVTSNESADDDSEQVMDFELDAGAIYASFRQQYGINLLTDELHWYEFRALLTGLGEDTSFMQRIKIRNLDLNDVAEKDRPKLRKLKDMVAIKPAMSKEEAALQAELDRRLAAGEDPSDILNQLQREV